MRLTGGSTILINLLVGASEIVANVANICHIYPCADTHTHTHTHTHTLTHTHTYALTASCANVAHVAFERQFQVSPVKIHKLVIKI